MMLRLDSSRFEPADSPKAGQDGVLKLDSSRFKPADSPKAGQVKLDSSRFEPATDDRSLLSRVGTGISDIADTIGGEALRGVAGITSGFERFKGDGSVLDAVSDAVGLMNPNSTISAMASRIHALRRSRDKPFVESGFTKDLRKTAADQLKLVSPEGNALAEGFEPSGGLDPRTWSFGKNPSLFGFGMQGAKVAGNMVPILAAAVLTRGASLPITAVTGATLGGFQTGGFAGYDEQTRVAKMKEEELVGIPRFRELINEGIPWGEAQEQLASEAGNKAFDYAAPAGAFGGMLTSGLISKPAQAVFGKVFGTSKFSRVVGGTLIDVPLEGLQEVGESVAQSLGADAATGQSRDPFDGAFGQFTLGALGGVGPAVVGGLSDLDAPQPQRDVIDPEDAGDRVRDQFGGRGGRPFTFDEDGNIIPDQDGAPPPTKVGMPIPAGPVSGATIRSNKSLIDSAMPIPAGPVSGATPSDFLVDRTGVASAASDYAGRQQERALRSGGPGMGGPVEGSTLSNGQLAQATFDSTMEVIRQETGKAVKATSKKALAKRIADRFAVNADELLAGKLNSPAVPVARTATAASSTQAVTPVASPIASPTGRASGTVVEPNVPRGTSIPEPEDLSEPIPVLEDRPDPETDPEFYGLPKRVVARSRKRSRKDFDENYDDLLDFAALHGGLDRDAFRKEGVDPALWRTRDAQRRNRPFGPFGPVLFRKGEGMTLADFAEKVREAHFFPDESFDSETQIDDNEVLSMVMESLNQGRKFFTMGGIGTQKEIEGIRHNENMAQSFVDGQRKDDDLAKSMRMNRASLFDEHSRAEALGELRRQELSEGVPFQDEQEALSLAEITDRIAEAGGTGRQILDIEIEFSGKERGIAMRGLMNQLEKANGADKRATDPNHRRGIQAAEGGEAAIPKGAAKAAADEGAADALIARKDARIEELEKELATDAKTRIKSEWAFNRDAPNAKGVAFIDIIAFKGYNTKFAETGGDVILKAFAAAMDKAAEGRAYRFGGDEFAFLSDVSPEHAQGMVDAFTEEASRLDLIVTDPEGIDYGIRGVPFRFGIGATTDDAAHDNARKKVEGDRFVNPNVFRVTDSVERSGEDRRAVDRREHRAEREQLKLTDDTVVRPPAVERAPSQGSLIPVATPIDRERLRFERDKPVLPKDQAQADIEELGIGAVPVPKPAASAATTEESNNAQLRQDQDRHGNRSRRTAQPEPGPEGQGVHGRDDGQGGREDGVQGQHEQDGKPDGVQKRRAVQGQPEDVSTTGPAAPSAEADPTSDNTIFTDEAAERARALLKSRLGRLNSGLDPEMVQAGITLAGWHIERGARTFATFAKAMLADLGDVVRPYLKSWYMAAKYDPRLADVADELSSATEVEAADVNSIEGVSDVSDSDSNLESDRENAAAPPPRVGGPVQDGSRGTTRSTGSAGTAVGREGVQRQDDSGVSADSAASIGERGNIELFSGPFVDQPALGSAGADLDQRGGGLGDAGIPIEPYSDAESIKDLFDRIEDGTIPERSKPHVEPTVASQVEGSGSKDLAGLPVVEHVTKAGKTLQGVIKKGISSREAKALDPFTFSKNGGFFIRLKPSKRGGGTFSQPSGSPGPGMSLESIQVIASRVAVDGVDVVAVSDPEGLPEAAKADPDYKTAEAWTDGAGKVYLVASNMANADRARAVVAHEIVGHIGVERVLGSEWEGIADTLEAIRNGDGQASAALRDAVKSAAERYPKADRATFTKEAVAVMAERGVKGGLWDRIVAAVRKFMRKALGRLQWSEAEIRDVLRRAEESVAGKADKAASVDSDVPSQSLFSKPGLSWDAPTDSRIDSFIYNIVDQHIDTKRVQQVIAERFGPVKDQHDVHGQETLSHGRGDKRTKDFLYRELVPLLRDMGKSKVTAEAFDRFLWARTAEERNVEMAKRNPNAFELGAMIAALDSKIEAIKTKRDALNTRIRSASGETAATLRAERDILNAQLASLRGTRESLNNTEPYRGSEKDRQMLSGMSTKEATEYLAALPKGERAVLNRLADQVDKIIAGTRRLLVSYGLESQATVDSITSTYNHYVPLHREDMESGGSGHQGISVRGSSIKAAVGSTRKVIDILANVALQRERVIGKGENNRLANALVGLVKQFPNDDFWTIEEPPMIAQLNPKTGFVEKAIDQAYKLRPETIVARVPQKDGSVAEMVVIFNKSNDRAMRMATALKGLNGNELGWFLGSATHVTRFMTAMNTRYNIMFWPKNFERDIEAGLLNLSSTELHGKQKEIAKNIAPALKGAYLYLRQRRIDGTIPDNEWSRTFEKFLNSGASTGYRDLFRTSEARAKELVKEIDRAQKGVALRAPKAVVDWMSDGNEAIETGIRLAVYKAGLDAGLSPAKSGLLAKNITTNFNQKGASAAQIGSLYGFYNASVQGQARMVETLTHGAPGVRGKVARRVLGKVGRRIVKGGLLAGALQAVLLAVAGFDDDDPPQFVRERNFIVPYWKGKYMMRPMPLGFNVLPNIGRITTEWLLDGGKNTGERMTRLLGVIADAFNPIGSGTAAQIALPTIADPFAAVIENKKFSGAPVYPEQFNSLDEEPAHMHARPSATVTSVAISEAVNYLTGGSDFRPGRVSIPPDAIDFLVGQAFGGTGREALKLRATMASLFTGDEVEPYNRFLLGAYLGDTGSPASVRSAFYKNVRALNGLENEITGRRRKHEDTEGFVEENPMSKAIVLGKAAYGINSALKKLHEAAIANKRDAEAKLIEQQMIDNMRRLNEAVERTQ